VHFGVSLEEDKSPKLNLGGSWVSSYEDIKLYVAERLLGDVNSGCVGDRIVEEGHREFKDAMLVNSDGADLTPTRKRKGDLHLYIRL